MSQNDREATVNLEHELDSTFSDSRMVEIRDGVAYPIRKTCRKPSEARIQDAPAVSSAANTSHQPAQIVETISNSVGKKITKRVNIGRFTKREICLLFFITIAFIGCIVMALKMGIKPDGEVDNQPKALQVSNNLEVSPPSKDLKKLKKDVREAEEKINFLQYNLNTLNSTLLEKVDIIIDQKLEEYKESVVKKLIKSSKNAYTDQKFETLQTTVVALKNKLTAVNKTIQDNQDLTKKVADVQTELKDTQNELKELETAIDAETCEQLNDQLNEVKNELMLQNGLLKLIEEKVKDEPTSAPPTTPTCKSDRKECNRRTVCFASVPIKQILDNTESCSNTNPNSKRQRRSCVSKQRRDSNCVEKAKKTYNCGNSVESTTESSISWVQFQKDFKRMIKEKKKEQTEIEAKREKNRCVKKPSPQPCVKTMCPKKASIKTIEPRRITPPSGCKKQSTTSLKVIAPRPIACKKSCEPKCKCPNRIAPATTTPASPATPSCSCPKKSKPLKNIKWDFNPDTSINPGKDYYEYVNKNWLKNNPMPDDYKEKEYSIKTLVINSISEKLKGILESEEHKSKLPVQLYKAGMDEHTLENEKFKAIEKPLSALNAAKTKSEIFDLGITKRGKFNLPTLFNIHTGSDLNDPENNIIYLGHAYSGALILSDRDYYLEDSIKEEIEKYLNEYLKKILDITRQDSSKTGDIVKFETEVAKIQLSKIELEDYKKRYHIKTRSELSELAPAFDWDNYWNSGTVIKEGKICVSSPEYLSKLSALWNSTDIETLRSYFIARTIVSAASYMPDDIYKIISGQTEPQPRWKRVLSTVKDSLGEPLGKIYSELYFNSMSKDKCLQMVEVIRETLKDKINNVDWMSAETKVKALKKVNSYGVKVGFPNKWKDFSSIDFSKDAAPTYYEKFLAASKFGFDYNLNEAYQPVDKEKWSLNAYDVMARYYPINNEIVFPAGILQAPFFNFDYTDAENFGGIGAVIAHEMTHGFDDKGLMSEQDIENYQERTKLIYEQFSSFKLYGESIKGHTMRENIADIGGIKLAFAGVQRKLEAAGKNASDIYKAVDKSSLDYRERYSPAELVFMSYARVWCAHITKEETIRRISADNHSPNYFRVNGVLGNIREFFKTYELGEDADMWPKAGMAEIW